MKLVNQSRSFLNIAVRTPQASKIADIRAFRVHAKDEDAPAPLPEI